jgi:hypothetical protein
MGAGRKGGKALAVVVASEVADEAAYGVVTVAELLRNGRHRLPVNEEGTQCFVVALPGVGRLEEEGSVSNIVHDAPRSCGAFTGSMQLQCYPIESKGPEWADAAELLKKADFTRSSADGVFRHGVTEPVKRACSASERQE